MCIVVYLYNLWKRKKKKKRKKANREEGYRKQLGDFFPACVSDTCRIP